MVSNLFILNTMLLINHFSLVFSLFDFIYNDVMTNFFFIVVSCVMSLCYSTTFFFEKLEYWKCKINACFFRFQWKIWKKIFIFSQFDGFFFTNTTTLINVDFFSMSNVIYVYFYSVIPIVTHHLHVSIFSQISC